MAGTVRFIQPQFVQLGGVNASQAFVRRLRTS
jgi:hypothetical protein